MVPLLLEAGQVPVHGGQRNVRVFRLHHGVECLGAGVSGGPLKAGKNGVALAELLGFHIRPPRE